ncbi:hypothetical protein HK098_003542 [Nowakowskiella sp. JEL0407]|nr:hypothetical protein HK098_003542 [Nowakowskiella sp. JEL0407]
MRSDTVDVSGPYEIEEPTLQLRALRISVPQSFIEKCLELAAKFVGKTEALELNVKVWEITADNSYHAWIKTDNVFDLNFVLHPSLTDEALQDVAFLVSESETRSTNKDENGMIVVKLPEFDAQALSLFLRALLMDDLFCKIYCCVTTDDLVLEIKRIADYFGRKDVGEAFVSETSTKKPRTISNYDSVNRKDDSGGHNEDKLDLFVEEYLQWRGSVLIEE